jgi:hypothetical protein
MRLVIGPTTALAFVALAMFVAGCAPPAPTGGTSPAADADHDEQDGHEHGDHEGHDHADGEHGHDDHDGHDHDGHDHGGGDHAGHDHANEHKGPHDGHVIELGRSHEFHAELVDDEKAETLTVYILGKDLKELPIEAASITMNLMVDGQPKTFELAGATADKSSQFNAADKSLFEALHVHEATGKVRITIGGTPYSGDVEHHHHGDDHDDDHGDHKH